MISLLIALALGVPLDCPWGSVCAKGDHSASVTLTLTLNLQSAESMAMTVDDLGHGAYAVNLQGISTGHPDAVTVAERYLVLADHDDLQKLAFSWQGGKFQHEAPDTVLVMRWPTEGTNTAVARRLEP